MDRMTMLVKLVRLDQGDACCIVFAAHDGRVGTRSELTKDRSLTDVRRRDGSSP